MYKRQQANRRKQHALKPGRVESDCAARLDGPSSNDVACVFGVRILCPTAATNVACLESCCTVPFVLLYLGTPNLSQSCSCRTLLYLSICAVNSCTFRTLLLLLLLSEQLRSQIGFVGVGVEATQKLLSRHAEENQQYKKHRKETTYAFGRFPSIGDVGARSCLCAQGWRGVCVLLPVLPFWSAGFAPLMMVRGQIGPLALV